MYGIAFSAGKQMYGIDFSLGKHKFSLIEECCTVHRQKGLSMRATIDVLHHFFFSGSSLYELKTYPKKLI